jgi:hypothetical protein
VIPSSFYLNCEQRIYQILNEQSAGNLEPIIEDQPEPHTSSSEVVGSSSWGHSKSHSPTSPTEQGHQQYPHSLSPKVVCALHRIRDSRFWNLPEQDPEQDLEGLEYVEDDQQLM